jgi:predicted ester cyclase
VSLAAFLRLHRPGSPLAQTGTHGASRTAATPTNPIAAHTDVTLKLDARTKESHPLQRKEKEAMSTEHNKQVVLRWKDEIWNKRNVNIVDELYAPDYIGHIAGTPGPIRGREAFKQLVTAYLAAFDIHLTSQFLIAEGDMVAVYDTIRLKHTGAFQGIPPTRKEATVTSTDIYRIVDGKIVEQWTEGNMLDLMQQLGALPAPGHATA